MKVWSWLALVLIFAALAYAEAAPSVLNGGPVSGFLTVENSPYTVNETIEVPEGKALVIEAGVTLKFKSGVGLDVCGGSFMVMGTEDRPVVFEGEDGSETEIEHYNLDVELGVHVFGDLYVVGNFSRAKELSDVGDVSWNEWGAGFGTIFSIFSKTMLFADVVFTADGMVQWCLPIPEGATQEQIDEAIASGELKMSAGGKMIVEEKPWKEENGKIFYDTGAKGEVLGEAVSPWVEVPEEDGMIQLMVYKLKKV